MIFAKYLIIVVILNVKEINVHLKNAKMVNVYLNAKKEMKCAKILLNIHFAKSIVLLIVKAKDAFQLLILILIVIEKKIKLVLVKKEMMMKNVNIHIMILIVILKKILTANMLILIVILKKTQIVNMLILIVIPIKIQVAKINLIPNLNKNVMLKNKLKNINLIHLDLCNYLNVKMSQKEKQKMKKFMP